MIRRLLPILLLVGMVGAACSTDDGAEVSTSSSVAPDALSTLLVRIDQSVAAYVERAVLQRPELLDRSTKDDLVACTVATSRDIARSVYLNRTAQTPTTVQGQASNSLTELIMGEATAAVQSQIEPVIARCSRGS
jgi:hypothetical protein